MYWDDDEIDDIIRYPIEGAAGELGSEIYFIARSDLEESEVRKQHRAFLAENDFDHAPIRPYREREYYINETDEIQSIQEEQYIQHNESMLHCINILTEFPFGLVVFPDQIEWKIVTSADLNTRVAKEYLYSYYAETARAVSSLVEEEYDEADIQKVYPQVRNSGNALDYWEQAVDENVNLHPVEFMSMADLKEVIADSDELRNELNFTSKTQCREAFECVEKYRNRVMHGYRTISSEREEVIELAKSIEIATELTIAAGGDEPGFDLPY